MAQARLKLQIISLKMDLRKAKQDYNNLKGRIAAKETKAAYVQINMSDYERTCPISLSDLLDGLNTVVFLGLRKEYESFRRLSSVKGLRVIPVDTNFNASAIKYADFVFVYKNCITHSMVARAIDTLDKTPVCLLSEPTNETLLENGLSNVLYRTFYR